MSLDKEAGGFRWDDGVLLLKLAPSEIRQPGLFNL